VAVSLLPVKEKPDLRMQRSLRNLLLLPLFDLAEQEPRFVVVHRVMQVRLCTGPSAEKSEKRARLGGYGGAPPLASFPWPAWPGLGGVRKVRAEAGGTPICDLQGE
jgi:hypothetical protein